MDLSFDVYRNNLTSIGNGKLTLNSGMAIAYYGIVSFISMYRTIVWK